MAKANAASEHHRARANAHGIRCLGSTYTNSKADIISVQRRRRVCRRSTPGLPRNSRPVFLGTTVCGSRMRRASRKSSIWRCIFSKPSARRPACDSRWRHS